MLSWARDDAGATAAIERIAASIATLAPGYELVAREPGLLIATCDAPLRALEPGRYLIGEVFPRPGQTSQANRTVKTGGSFDAFCQRLAADRWGRYVAVDHDPGGQGSLAIFVDPIGMRESVTWVHAGVRIIASRADTWLMHWPPRDLAIDHAEIAQLIAHPSWVTDCQPFEGVTALAAGALTRFVTNGRPKVDRLWRPHDFCRASRSVEDPGVLARLVDDCIGAWSSVCAPAILELSGGLDSAIVAAALSRQQRPLGSFTFFSGDLAGDERRFSRAIVGKLGLPNVEMALVPFAMDERWMARTAIGIRPGLGSTTLFHDRDLATRGADLGARAVFTGRGGDAVFFQHPTPSIAAEPWPQSTRSRLARAEALARWSRANVWAVARHGLLPRFHGTNAQAPATAFAAGRSAMRHPSWVGRQSGLSRAKRMQVEALNADRAAFGPSSCGQAFDVVHPLLSQPLVEFALSHSIMALTAGRRDRALARSAFAGRLPASVISRRGKGSLSTFYGRTLAMSAPFLREFLLDGALREARLIDHRTLERVLTRDHLMQHDCYTTVLGLLLIEQWLRVWGARLDQRTSPS